MVSKNSHLVQMYFWNDVLARTTHLVWKSHSQHCICDLNWVGFHGCIVWDTECAEIVNDSSTQVQLPQLTLSLQYVWAAQVGSPLVLPEPGSVSEGTTEALNGSLMQTASSLSRALSLTRRKRAATYTYACYLHNAKILESELRHSVIPFQS